VDVVVLHAMAIPYRTRSRFDGQALFERRDLKPTLDTRAVSKAAIPGTFDLTRPQADRSFPDRMRWGASTT
jgi:uncharacterized protein (DUF1501 family)